MQTLAQKDNPVIYRRRKPEAGVIYQVLQENLNTFLDRIESDPSRSGLPYHVKKELHDYLDCGILSSGFLRIYCEGCKRSQVVALSCKHRGFCPSCGGRRMRERSLHLVERVFPEAPVRQWVLSVPIQVRYLLAYKPELTTLVLTIYIRTITNWIRKQARAKGFKKAQTGAVTVIQRAGSSGNLNVHLHGLFLDGYFVREPGSGKLKFHKIKCPDDNDVAAVLLKIREKVIRSLKKRGFLNDFDDDIEATTFETFMAASVRYRSASGERAGQRTRMLGQDPYRDVEVNLKGKCCATSEGFSLHANTRISAKNRVGLEKMCAYISRPPIAAERLSRRADGQILLRFKRPFADGTAFALYEPLEFVEKLAALVPPPWANLIRFHGCFAPNAKTRKEIVPKVEGEPHGRRPEWAEILKRSFEIDIFQCGYCGGKTKIIAVILDPETVSAILKSLGLPTDSPEIAPARASPQVQFDWGA